MNILLAIIFILTPMLSLKIYNKHFFKNGDEQKWTILSIIAFTIELLFVIVVGNYFITTWEHYSIFIIGPFLIIAIGSAIVDQKKSS